MKAQRLFVGNLPEGTSESDLKKEFAAYGNVKSVDLKKKPNGIGGIDIFAFLNLESDDRGIWQCINEFKQEQYKGVFLNVSKAKESFLEKLKREREEAEAEKQASTNLNPYKKTEKLEEKEKKKPELLPALPTIEKEVSESSSESESEEDEPVVVPQRNPFLKPKNEDEVIKRWNQEAFIERGKLKIVPITGQVTEIIDKSRNKNQSRDLDEKGKLADVKRKEALSKNSSAYEQQKLAIKAALSGNIKKNKIVFDDADEDFPKSKKRKTLFDGGEDDDDFVGNFEVKKQFRGEKGQQLYEMQTAFKGDRRFKMDEKFLEDGGVEETFEEDDERKKQLEILSSVTGKQFQNNQFNSNQKTQKMQRFDPTKQSAENFQKHTKKIDPYASKRRDFVDNDFKVSDEKFYKVSEKIGEVIGKSEKTDQSQGFSLLSMLGRGDHDEAEHEEDEPEYNEKIITDKKSFRGSKFKYDSEDSDAENKAVEKQKAVKKEPSVKDKKKDKAGYFSKQGVWREKFFLLSGDPRLEEGKKFFEKSTSGQVIRDDHKSEDIRTIKAIMKKRVNRKLNKVNAERKKRGLKLKKTNKK